MGEQACARSGAPSCMSLPLDVWLVIFDVMQLDDLWSTVRNISRTLRAYVDDYFCHGLVQNMLVGIYYSTINRERGPTNFQYVRIPLRFASLSRDGSMAVFRQVGYKDQIAGNAKGSLRGWVPFIERHCKEMLQPKPKVLNKGKREKELPQWEANYVSLRSSLVAHERKSYSVTLRDHTSIGRGDRPPYFVSIGGLVHDTELVNLVIDCSSRELSFDWRHTLSALFMEQHHLILSARSSGLYKKNHDESLRLVALRMASQGYQGDGTTDHRRVRRKRLRPWVLMNRTRMTDEHRLLTEHRVELESLYVRKYLYKENLEELKEEDLLGEEFVPEKCSKDYAELLKWPWHGRNEPARQSTRPSCGLKCTVL